MESADIEKRQIITFDLLHKALVKPDKLKVKVPTSGDEEQVRLAYSEGSAPHLKAAEIRNLLKELAAGLCKPGIPTSKALENHIAEALENGRLRITFGSPEMRSRVTNGVSLILNPGSSRHSVELRSEILAAEFVGLCRAAMPETLKL